LVFPLWSGTPVKVNNIAVSGYPQFKGDPNRYQPVATTVAPNTYPYYSFTIGTTGKLPKSGDLYLQEGNDSFNSYSSSDGHVWEFNSVAGTWTFTGVNIKGAAGSTGSTGATEWLRDTDSSAPTPFDVLYPSVDPAHSDVVRVLIGTDDVSVIEDGTGIHTNNILTVYSDLGGAQIALTDNNFVAPSIDPDDYAQLKVSSGTFYLWGQNDPSANTKNIEIEAFSGLINLYSNDPTISTTAYMQLDASTKTLTVNNAALNISCSPSASLPNQVTMHVFDDTNVALNVRHNKDITYGGWTSGRSIRLYTTATALPSDMYLQEGTTNRLGVGTYTANRPISKLAINTSSQNLVALSIGNNWSLSSSTITGYGDGGESLSNTSMIEGQLIVGTGSGSNQPYKLGLYSFNSISTKAAINMQNGYLGFNSFIDGTTANRKLASAGSTLTTPYNYFMAQGSILTAPNAISGAIGADLTGSLIIGGSQQDMTSVGSYLTATSQISTQGFLPGLVFRSATSQILLNAQKWTNHLGSSNAGSNLLSWGGAVIGKLSRFNGDTVLGHSDAVANNNIIIGFPQGTNANSPRVITTSAGDTLTTSKSNNVYLTTPVWVGSMLFDQSSETYTATTSSKSSITAGEPYTLYMPSVNSQMKLVHGVNWNFGTANQLDATRNPNSTGVGLEIETKFGLNASVSTGSPGRTPMIFTGAPSTSTAVKGNRPILISKRNVSNATINHTIFEVSPFSNVSIGKSFQYPDKTINYGNNTRQAAPQGLAYLPDQTITITGNTNISLPWSGGAPFDNTSGFILPDGNRSLHINTIRFDGEDDLKASALDQGIYRLRAGIVFEGAQISLAPGTPGSDAADGAFAQYYEGIDAFIHTMVTTSTAFKEATSTSRNIVTSYPLGLKPGSVNFIQTVAANLSTRPNIAKGSDVLIEGGDIIFSLPTGTPAADRVAGKSGTLPGDVFISGGVAYYDKYQDGFSDARSYINGSGYDTGLKRNFGNVYLGSRVTDSQTAIGGISKAGLVYVGYDSVNADQFNRTSTDYSPKGKASLNVTGFTPSSRHSDGILTANKAINIQVGDIVSRDQDAGWITIELTDSQFRSAETLGISSSEVIFCYNNSSNLAAVHQVLANQLTPRWTLRYKVIGYTVHYNIKFEGLRWNVNTSSENGQLIFLAAAEDLFSTSSATSLIPRPKTFTPASAYASGVTTNTFNLPNRNSRAFNGTGFLYLRNANNNSNWPLQGGGTFSIVTSTPVSAVWDQDSSRISIFKSGASVVPNTTAADFTTGLLRWCNSFRNFIPISGVDITGSATLATNGTGVFADLYLSGTYELDPQYWY
jgi:hypothetical protein